MKRLLQTILIATATVVCSISAFAQTHKNGVGEISYLEAYIRETYGKHPGYQDWKLKSAVAREECGEIYNSSPNGYSCEACRQMRNDCEPAPEFTNIATFGKHDPRKTAEGDIKKEDMPQANSVAALFCPDPLGGTNKSTMNLVKVEGYPGQNKLLGVAHGLITEKTARALQAGGATDDQLVEAVDKILAKCELYATKINGKKIGKPLKIASYKIGTYFPDSESHKDALLIELGESSPHLQPLLIRATTKQALLGKMGKMIAYHHDIVNTVTNDEGELEEVNPKRKSAGVFSDTDPRHTFAKHKNVILHNIPSNGQASGAVVTDISGVGVVLHRSGINDDGGEFDGKKRYNRGLVIDQDMIGFIVN